METKTWGVHAEFAIIFITLLGGFYMLDGKIERTNEKIAQQGARTDKLYEMFVDMRKDFYKETSEFQARVNIIETKIEERSKK